MEIIISKFQKEVHFRKSRNLKIIELGLNITYDHIHFYVLAIPLVNMKVLYCHHFHLSSIHLNQWIEIHSIIKIKNKIMSIV